MKLNLIIILFFSVNLMSQSEDILKLEKQKISLINKVKLLNDSIKKINDKIVYLKSEEILKTVTDSSFISSSRKGAYIKKEPKLISDILVKFQEEKKIVLLDYIDGYFGVCSDSICGYMSELWVIKNKRVKNFIRIKNNEYEELKKIEEEKKRKVKKIEYAKLEKVYIKRYGKKIYDKLKKGYYWIGMTKEMTILSLGSPNDINRSVGSWGIHEQWVYEGINLYFENGKLTSYQD